MPSSQDMEDTRTAETVRMICKQERSEKAFLDDHAVCIDCYEAVFCKPCKKWEERQEWTQMSRKDNGYNDNDRRKRYRQNYRRYGERSNNRYGVRHTNRFY